MSRTATRLALAVTRWWTGLYTLGAPPDSAR